jgi:hypothetical protein
MLVGRERGEGKDGGRGASRPCGGEGEGEGKGKGDEESVACYAKKVDSFKL